MEDYPGQPMRCMAVSPLEIVFSLRQGGLHRRLDPGQELDAARRRRATLAAAGQGDGQGEGPGNVSEYQFMHIVAMRSARVAEMRSQEQDVISSFSRHNQQVMCVM
jgi:hypothetical protein